MIVSDAPNCGVTYNRHYDNHNSFIIQATSRGVLTEVERRQWLYTIYILLVEQVSTRSTKPSSPRGSTLLNHLDVIA